MNQRRPDRGFTLIEVMVALAIAAIGLAAVLSVVTHATRNAAYMRQKILATWIGQNVVTELRVSGAFPATNSRSGRVHFAGADWAYEQVVIESGVAGLRRIDVAVRLAAQPSTEVVATVTGFVGATATSAPPSTTAWDVAAPGAPAGLTDASRAPARGGAAGVSSTLDEGTVQPTTATPDDNGGTSP